jgi:hypothetical protein
MARGKFPWHAAFTAVPIFYFLFPTSVTILWTLCVYTRISDTVQTVYELPLLPSNTTVKHCYTNRSGAKCWLDIYRWGAGMAVTGRIRDVGQNVLQASFETGSSSSTVTATFSSLSHSWRRPWLEIPGARSPWRLNFVWWWLNICESSVQNLLHVTLLTPRILT